MLGALISTGAALAAASPALATTGRISASPGKLSLGTCSLGSTDVSWSTSDHSNAQVRVSVNGTGNALFAEGPSGSQRANWIQPGTTVFSLWGGPSERTRLGETTVSAAHAAGAYRGSISASPSSVTVPANGTGSTTISWQTCDHSDAEVTVTRNGVTKLMAENPSGSELVNWIQAGPTTFTLLGGPGHGTPLAQLIVTGVPAAPADSAAPAQRAGHRTAPADHAAKRGRHRAHRRPSRHARRSHRTRRARRAR